VGAHESSEWQQWRLLGADAITEYRYGLDRAELPWARKREFVGELV
jgi:hypothetical protein